MDLGRFNRAVEQLADSPSNSAVSDEITRLISDLNGLAGNQTNQSFADAFRDHLEALRAVLEAQESLIRAGPGAEVVRTLKLERFFGNGLFENVKNAVATNQLSPSLAAGALTKLKAEIDSVFGSVLAIDTAFTKLKVGYEELDHEESEIQLSLPVDRDQKTLADLSLEAKEWNQIVSTISEVFDATRPISNIRTLATGSWLIYLSSTPLVLLGIAVTLKRINQILSELIRTRELIKQLKTVNAPTQQIEDHQQNKLSLDLKLLAQELVDKYYSGGTNERKSELVAATSISLTKLSRKIAAGAKVGLRIASPKSVSVADVDKPTAEEKTLIQAAEKFEAFKAKVDTEIAQIALIEGGADLMALLPAPSESEELEEA